MPIFDTIIAALRNNISRPETAMSMTKLAKSPQPALRASAFRQLVVKDAPVAQLEFHDDVLGTSKYRK